MGTVAAHTLPPLPINPMRTDNTEPPEQPPAITDHQLLRRVAAGSYGEVWLARCALGTYRAVKIVRRATFGDNPRPYEREFAGLKRFEPISREHEGLVDVLQVGRDDDAGFFYYVMELADTAAEGNEGAPAGGSDGNPADPQPVTLQSNKPSPLDLDSYTPRTLAHEVKVRGPLPADEVVRLASVLAEGLQFLHSKGLVHRDIKPSNIIFVNRVPKLADVGLVARLEETRSLGGGTIGFMPPEGPGTVQADIYSLGKVIYEAATGKDRQEFPERGIHLPQVTTRGSVGGLEMNRDI
jgi:serine/threonine protein kinase